MDYGSSTYQQMGLIDLLTPQLQLPAETYLEVFISSAILMWRNWIFIHMHECLVYVVAI